MSNNLTKITKNLTKSETICQVRTTKGEVTDQVMDTEEEEDSLSRKLFERTESLLGRFNIKYFSLFTILGRFNIK